MKIRTLVFGPYTPGDGPFGIPPGHLLVFQRKLLCCDFFRCSRLNAKLCCGDDQFPNAQFGYLEVWYHGIAPKGLAGF
jgi:hypothetical protein